MNDIKKPKSKTLSPISKVRSSRRRKSLLDLDLQIPPNELHLLSYIRVSLEESLKFIASDSNTREKYLETIGIDDELLEIFENCDKELDKKKTKGIVDGVKTIALNNGEVVKQANLYKAFNFKFDDSDSDANKRKINNWLTFYNVTVNSLSKNADIESIDKNLELEGLPVGEWLSECHSLIISHLIQSLLKFGKVEDIHDLIGVSKKFVTQFGDVDALHREVISSKIINKIQKDIAQDSRSMRSSFFKPRPALHHSMIQPGKIMIPKKYLLKLIRIGVLSDFRSNLRFHGAIWLEKLTALHNFSKKFGHMYPSMSHTKLPGQNESEKNHYKDLVSWIQRIRFMGESELEKREPELHKRLKLMGFIYNTNLQILFKDIKKEDVTTEMLYDFIRESKNIKSALDLYEKNLKSACEAKISND